MNTPLLSISIVIYRQDAAVLARTIATLAQSLHEAQVQGALYIVDNGPGSASSAVPVHDSAGSFSSVELIKGQGNVGYGRGHNLAIDRANSSYHLILNPDVEIAPDCILQARTYLDHNPEIGAISPRVTGPDGALQYLCRRYPTLWRLFLRGFAPDSIRRRFKRELERYEMKPELDQEQTLIDPPVITGCFMLFQTAILKRLKGFDARFFLYFEDYDLSIRTRQISHLAYVPQLRIMHRGGNAARKGLRHTIMFVQSAALFFRIHGWRLC